MIRWWKKRHEADEEWLPLPYEESIRLHALPEPPRPVLYEMLDWRGQLVGFSHRAPEPEPRRLSPRPRRRLSRRYAGHD